VASAAHRPRIALLAQNGRHEHAVAAYRKALSLELALQVRWHIADLAALSRSPHHAEEPDRCPPALRSVRVLDARRWSR
jgi:hypothetical protein